MKKKTPPKIFAILFIFYLLVSFLPAQEIFAVNLEVNYPEINLGAGKSQVTEESDLSQYLKYVFDAGIFIGFFAVFLSLIYAGVLYFLSPAIPSALADAKDRISGAISGLLILVLLYLIITTVNPHLAIFKVSKLEAPPAEEPSTKSPGVNFYKSGNCSGIADTRVNNVSDFGENLRNKINSVKIEHNSRDNLYYIAVIYDMTNYWGKCQYINPNEPCFKVEPFAASASIYRYDYSPKGDGVYIYRKSFSQTAGKEENKSGGYLKISNAQIIGAKGKSFNLDKLKFTGESSNYENLDDCTVPKEEQDCAKYDQTGKCVQRECPKLNKKNISSIEIAGNYVVWLICAGPEDSGAGPWTYCQSYSSSIDVNKEGPAQIKWDAIRSRGQDPNFMLIAPVVEK
jgi:hypothetical protein